jgi:hypothetical protein
MKSINHKNSSLSIASICFSQVLFQILAAIKFEDTSIKSKPKTLSEIQEKNYPFSSLYGAPFGSAWRE